MILNDDRIHCIYLWEQMSERWNSHRAFALIKGLLLFRKQIKKCDAVLTYGRANYMLVTALASNQKARVFARLPNIRSIWVRVGYKESAYELVYG